MAPQDVVDMINGVAKHIGSVGALLLSLEAFGLTTKMQRWVRVRIRRIAKMKFDGSLMPTLATVSAAGLSILFISMDQILGR